MTCNLSGAVMILMNLLLRHYCGCIDSKDTVKNLTVMKMNSTNETHTNSVHLSNDTLEYYELNGVENTSIVTDSEKISQVTEFPKHRKKELPLAIIIAGPAATLSICIFLCIAFYFHNLQLNNRAKQLSFTLHIKPDVSSDSTTCTSSTSTQVQLLPQTSNTRGLSREEILSQKRKSALTASTLPVPPTVQPKRGSSWNALADQELVSIPAPRKHSTFLL